jgi:hypothetical protein
MDRDYDGTWSGTTLGHIGSTKIVPDSDDNVGHGSTKLGLSDDSTQPSWTVL